MKNIIVYITIVVLMFTSSCQNKTQPKKNSITSFDLSKDDRQIVFSYSTQNGSSIYKVNIDGSMPLLLIKANNLYSYYNPRYSPNGKKILFIRCLRNNVISSDLCIANSDGSDIKQLTKGAEMITSIAFSDYSNKIYYSKACEFKNYSSIVKPQAHGMDLYSCDLITNKIEKISDLNSYGIYNISEIGPNNLLMYINGVGIHFYNKKDKILRRIPLIGLPDNDFSFYGYPIYSKKFKTIVFLSGFGLYRLDINNNKINFLYDTKEGIWIDNYCFFNSQRKILFSTEEDVNRLWSINIDGTNLQSITINLPVDTISTSSN